MKTQLKSFKHAIHGIAYCFKTQRNFKIHTLALILVGVLGYLLKCSTSEWLFLILVSFMVLAAELFNTALEFLSDKVEPNYCATIKAVKDLAAGAVLIVSLAALAVGLVVFIPKLAELL